MTSNEIRDVILDAARKGWNEGAATVPFPEQLISLCLTTAIKAERKACAKVCDDLYEEMYPDIEFGGVSSAAEKIRARSQDAT